MKDTTITVRLGDDEFQHLAFLKDVMSDDVRPLTNSDVVRYAINVLYSLRGQN